MTMKGAVNGPSVLKWSRANEGLLGPSVAFFGLYFRPSGWNRPFKNSAIYFRLYFYAFWFSGFDLIAEDQKAEKNMTKNKGPKRP